MNFKKKLSIAAETMVAICMVAVMVVACGGGSSSGISQTYIASAGVGEILLSFSVNTTNMTYSYSVLDSALSGVSKGQTGTGTLSGANPAGSYNVGPSIDGLILSGKVLPLASGVMVGHVALATFGSQINIPVFGIPNPITTPSIVNGVYNYQGFSCSATGIANVASAPVSTSCAANFGTMSIAGIISTSSGATYTDCKGGNLYDQAGNPCSPSSTGTIVQIAGTPGVYDFLNDLNHHIGWFFAFTAPNGQIVGVIDHDDSISAPNEYGYTVLSTYAIATTGVANGSYLVETNENAEQWVNITTMSSIDANNVVTISTIYTSTAQSGVQGTLTPNSPWSGLSTYYLAASGAAPAVSGVAMVAGNGAYTHTSLIDPALFAVGSRYGP